MTKDEILLIPEEIPPEGVGLVLIKYNFIQKEEIKVLKAVDWFRFYDKKETNLRGSARRSSVSLGFIFQYNGKRYLYDRPVVSTATIRSVKRLIKSLCMTPGPIHKIDTKEFDHFAALVHLYQMKEARKSILSFSEKREINSIETFIIHDFLINL